MKKKWGLLIAGVVVVLLLAAGLWYTRPMTLEQLFPELDWSDSGGMSAVLTLRETHPDGKVDSGFAAVNLPAGDPAIAELLELLDTRYHRSLLGLLPWVSAAPAVDDDPYSWHLAVGGDSSSLFVQCTEGGTYLDWSFYGSPTAKRSSVLCGVQDQAAFERAVYDWLMGHRSEE